MLAVALSLAAAAAFAASAMFIGSVTRRVGSLQLSRWQTSLAFLVAALAWGDVGIAMTLASTTLILIQPMACAVYRRLPGPLAWVGAWQIDCRRD